MLNRLIILLGIVSLLSTDSFAKNKSEDSPHADIKVSYNYHH